MLEYLYQARWDQVYAFLASGSPPMVVRLLALNALFVALLAIRRAAGSPPMTSGGVLFAQLTVLGANLLVLFQTEVEAYLLQAISGT